MALFSARTAAWLKEWFSMHGYNTAVVGISGDRNSAVVAALCARALGPEHVVGVMMPNGTSMSWEDQTDALQVIQELGIRHYTIELWEPYTWLCSAICSGTRNEVSSNAKRNIVPRLRTAVLFAIAQTLSEAEDVSACVTGSDSQGDRAAGYTSNRDDSAYNVNPILDLWNDEVLQLGEELGFFPNILQKTPAANPGQAEEEHLKVFGGRGEASADIS